MQYTVFVSHNRQNKPWVRAFVRFLRLQDVSVFFDEDTIPYGSDVTSAIEEGVENSSHVLLIITPASVRSHWVALEASMTVYSDPAAQQRRLIPVLLEETNAKDIRASVRRLNMVDLTRPEIAERSFRKLMKQLGIRDADTLHLPPLLPDRSLSGEPPGGKNQSIFRFRRPATDWYVPRKEEQLLKEILSDTDDSRPNVLITGKTGVGKSSFLNWIGRRAMSQGAQVVHCVPLSDRVDDLLQLITRHTTALLNSLEIQPPQMTGVLTADCELLLEKLTGKTNSKVFVLVDQLERLLPYAGGSGADAHRVWATLMDAFAGLGNWGTVTWVFAVKEWFFLSLFPSEAQLRLNGFTYVSLGDLDIAEARTLLSKIAALAGTAVDEPGVDLLAQKTGGRALSLVLAFILAVERSPDPEALTYDYLTKAEPWNDIFDADYGALSSSVQKYVVLAIAHSGREIVPEEQVVKKVSLITTEPEESIREALRTLDHDHGLIVRNDGLVSFVHSGFGVFIDGRYSSHYPPEWKAFSSAWGDGEGRRDFMATGVMQTMLAQIAHRMGNVFAVSQASLHMLDRAVKDKDWDKVPQYSERVSETIRRAMESIRDLRSSAQYLYRDPNTYTVIIPTIEKAIRAVQALQKKGKLSIQFKERPSVADLRVSGDPDRIAEVITHILQNAVVHGPTEGLQVEIRCRLDRVSPVLICEIEDNGPGLNTKVKSRLFEPFFTTRADSGTGLGLAIAKRVIESFGGAIAEIGTPGKGACFQLRLPLFSLPDNEHPSEEDVHLSNEQP